MTTRERIVDEALTLFSIKGFKGTSVKNIADAVGIKDSSLYKHFKSKREIFDTIVLKMRKRMECMTEQIGLPDEEKLEEAAKFYGRITLEDLQEFSRKAFLFYLKDEFISRFWRLANMEQYQNPEIYEIYRQIFMEESIAYQKQLFSMMIHNGSFAKGDPQIMAISFYAPIFFLLSKYNGREEGVSEALDILDRQIQEFSQIYSRKSQEKE